MTGNNIALPDGIEQERFAVCFSPKVPAMNQTGPVDSQGIRSRGIQYRV